MKYENPTCEIVLLDSADCLDASKGRVYGLDTPDVDWGTPTF